MEGPHGAVINSSVVCQTNSQYHPKSCWDCALEQLAGRVHVDVLSRPCLSGHLQRHSFIMRVDGWINGERNCH